MFPEEFSEIFRTAIKGIPLGGLWLNTNNISSKAWCNGRIRIQFPRRLCRFKTVSFHIFQNQLLLFYRTPLPNNFKNISYFLSYIRIIHLVSKIFRKANIFYPIIRTRPLCVSWGKKCSLVYRKILRTYETKDPVQRVFLQVIFLLGRLKISLLILSELKRIN